MTVIPVEGGKCFTSTNVREVLANLVNAEKGTTFNAI